MTLPAVWYLDREDNQVFVAISSALLGTSSTSNAGSAINKLGIVKDIKPGVSKGKQVVQVRLNINSVYYRVKLNMTRASISMFCLLYVSLCMPV